MVQETINPYDALIVDFIEGLNYIIEDLPVDPNVDDLTNSIVDYMATVLGTLTDPMEIEIRSVIGNTINSFTNNKCQSLYNGTQRSFVNQMTIPHFIDADTVDTIPDRIRDIEINIPQCGLSVDQQTPLFLATLMGTYSYFYFLNAINEGDTDWQPYFDNALTSAIANLPFWTEASMEGALIGARLSPRGLIAPTTDIVTVEIVSALIAGLTTTAGVVIFKWSHAVEKNDHCHQIGGAGTQTFYSRIDENTTGIINLQYRNNVAYIKTDIVPASANDKTEFHNLTGFKPTAKDGKMVLHFDSTCSGDTHWFVSFRGQPPVVLEKEGDFCISCFCFVGTGYCSVGQSGGAMYCTPAGGGCQQCIMNVTIGRGCDAVGSESVIYNGGGIFLKAERVEML